MKLNQIKTFLYNQGVIPSDDKELYFIKCPLHNEKKGMSFSINFKKGYYVCRGKCQEVGNLNKLFAKLGYHNLKIDQNEFNLNHLKDKQETLQKSKIVEIIEKPIKLFKKDYSYLINRGISQEICTLNQVSYCDYNNRFYFPIWFNNKCYGNISRSLFNEDRIVNELSIKYKKELSYDDFLNPENEELNQLYLNRYMVFSKYHNEKDMLKDYIVYEPLSNLAGKDYLLTEGCIDALSANMLGFNAFSKLGSGLTKYQVNYMLNKVEKEGVKLIIATDNDKAGRKMFDEIRLKSGKMLELFDLKDCKDLNEYLLKYKN